VKEIRAENEAAREHRVHPAEIEVIDHPTRVLLVMIFTTRSGPSREEIHKTGDGPRAKQLIDQNDDSMRFDEEPQVEETMTRARDDFPNSFRNES
jgi:hypothetical protein